MLHDHQVVFLVCGIFFSMQQVIWCSVTLILCLLFNHLSAKNQKKSGLMVFKISFLFATIPNIAEYLLLPIAIKTARFPNKNK